MTITERQKIAKARRAGLMRTVSRTEHTLATIANMNHAQEANVKCVAYSPMTGEEYSANPFDYLFLAEGEPMCDEDGRPMILVSKRTMFTDIFTGQEA